MNWKKNWKVLGAALLVTAACAAFAGCGGGEKAASAENEVKLGFINGTSGGVAAYGLSEKKGFDMAIAELNAKGPYHFSVEEADTKGVVAQAVAVAQKMTADKKLLVVGPLISGEYKAVAPIFEAARIPLLGAATTAEGLTDGGRYLFRNCVPESQNIPQTVAKTKKLLGYRTAALLYSHNNEHQVSAYNIFKKALTEAGVTIVADETFADKDSDFSAQLTKIQHADPDVVVVAGYYQEGGLILKKMREMGMDQPVLGDNGFVSPELIKIAGSAADGVYVSCMWSADRDSERTKEFVKNFTEKYGHEPDNFAACAYDSAYLAAAAVEKAQTVSDTGKVRDALASMENFDGVCGKMTFDESGDPKVDLVLLKVENGRYAAVSGV